MQQEGSKTLVQKQKVHLQKIWDSFAEIYFSLQEISTQKVPSIHSKELCTHSKHTMHARHRCKTAQSGEDSWDGLFFKYLSVKYPLILGLFCDK